MKEKKPIYKKWWFWAIIIFIIVGAAGNNGKNSTAKNENDKTEEKDVTTASKEVKNESEKKQEKPNKKEKEAKKDEDTTLTSGENGVLAEDVFVALGEDKTNYEEMFKYITKKNEPALKQMLLEGKILFANKGTPITVVDRGFVSAQVQIIETGERGWVPVEYLTKKVK